MTENASPPPVIAGVVVESPPPPPRRHDPWAAALGNACLLGVGYLLMRRWGLAIANAVISVVLILLVGAFGQPGWFWRGVLTLWWIATILHGWLLARRPPAAAVPAMAPAATAPAATAPAATAPTAAAPPATNVGRQRAIAVGATVAAGLLVAGLLFDAHRIEASAASAHEAGKCDEAIATLDQIAGWHRFADPYVTRRTADERAACGLLVQALAEDDPEQGAALLAQYLDSGDGRWQGAADRRADLLLTIAKNAIDNALAGDMSQLLAGFTVLGTVLDETPGRAGDVQAILTSYMDRLPQGDPCTATAQLDWLRERPPTGDQLDQPATQVDTLAPTALVACGDKLLVSDASGALTAYNALLERYPDSDLADAARTGVDKAETQLEADTVSRLVSGDPPGYCTTPAPYRAAPAWKGGGPHKLLPLISSQFADDVPTAWKALGYNDATLILCVKGPSSGRTLRTCDYEGGYRVTLHAARYDVKGYQLRTGTLAFDTSIQLTGGCPSILHWKCDYYFPNCPPPSSIRASYSDSAFRSAIHPWVFH